MDTSPPSSRIPRFHQVICLLAVLAGSAHTQEVSETDDHEAKIRTSLKALSPGAELKIAAEIRALGTEAVPTIFDMLARGRKPALYSNRGELTREQRRFLLRATATFGREILEERFRAIAAQEDAIEHRLIALQLLSTYATHAEYALALALIRQPEDEGLFLNRSLASAFEICLRSILKRDHAAMERTREWILRGNIPEKLAIIRALGSLKSARSLDYMIELLGEDPGVDQWLVPSVGQTAQRIPHAVTKKHRDKLRPYLSKGSLNLRRDAVLAVGKLEDWHAIDYLIELLDDRDAQTRKSALWSLRQITGRSFTASKKRWRAWVATEREWFENEAPHYFQNLSSPHRELVIRAISELSQVRYMRPLVARRMRFMLNSKDTEIQRIACEGLAQLGAPEAVLDLLTLLEGEHYARNAAVRALVTITGKELPARKDAWEEYLRLSD